MHEDEMLEDPRPPSRSQKRREALDVLRLAETLTAMSEAELARVPLEEALRDEVRRTRAISSHGARKRENQFLAKQLRKLDEESLEAIRRIIAHDRSETHRVAAALHRLETWRERLLDGGDEALNEFMVAYPHADRQQLRQLVRNALAERKADKPPHAFRELFRYLRGVQPDAQAS
ncbi:ribosome biogenesis factor YjgA [Dokdonella sp.]|uniref:ribosome biogenesis factor YjgA n=1 Tax=Dokdonella sp. TaxID=2291710 RepID=UPI003AF4F521